MLEDRLVLSNIFTVTSASDSLSATAGDGTLRGEILALNNSNAPGANVIDFNIGAGGAQTINLVGALPTITNAVTIDGSSQPSFAGTPLIVLNGTSAGASANGLTIAAGNSTVKDLAIDLFGGDGIDLQSGGNDVLTGNYIGVASDGKTGAGNGIGVVIESGSANNIVGGTASGAGNVISGNTYGVDITASGGTGNAVEGNYIGVASDGKTAAGNGFGVFIYSANNTVGGTTTAALNVISASDEEGVAIVGGGASGNAVEGNYIGTDVTGTAKLGNTYGVVIAQGAANNTVGGTTTAALNVISGNSYAGVQIQDSGSTGNAVQGNYIGTDKTGAAALANGYGVVIYSSANNTVDAGNVLSANTFGLAIYGTGATGNVLAGNYIGTDKTGTVKLGNYYGVFIDGPANNTVGGTTAAALNVISGNTFGAVIGGVSGTSGNVVEGNYIGTDSTGTVALANTYGVLVYASATGNTIGGTTAAALNVISGNTQEGVFIDGSGTTGNVVQGNYIGIDKTGTVKLGNTYGVVIADGAASNTVDSAVATTPVNVISGNTYGVDIYGTGSNGNVVAGNYIGTDKTGTVALGNTYGVALYASATGNTIGGTTAAARNIISASAQQGVLIDGSGTTGNVVEGNYIGTDVSGTNALGNTYGVGFTDAATNNVVGGTATGAANVIANSTSYGVYVIAGTGDAIRGNSIYNSGNLGIALLNGGNNNQAAPTLSLAATNTTSNLVAITGALTAAPSTTYNLDFYASPTANSSGSGEGQLYLGSAPVTTNASGTASFTETLTASVPAGWVVSATATDPSGNTSQFATDVKATANLFVVTNTGDNGGVNPAVGAGTGTLRQAIVDANAATGTSVIDFDINATGVQTINLAAALPTITNSVIINGASQATTQNELISTPLIVLNGSGAGSGATNGLTLTAGNSTVEDLTIDHFAGNGIELDTGGNNVLIGNYIGVDSTGATGAGNGNGVVIEGSANNTVGGTTAAARNIISANTTTGVEIVGNGATGNQVQGNYIGTDVSGTKNLGNAIGVDVASTNNTVGGTVSGAGNVLSGNSEWGVSIDSTGNAVQGNLIGTDLTGTKALGNGDDGVYIYEAANNTIGGTVAAARNIISANTGGGTGGGVYITGSAATGNLVEGNYIGTDVSGTAKLGNGTGVVIMASGNTVGGTTATARNVIAASTFDGVFLGGNSNVVEGNYIGTNASGTAALANSRDGVYVNSAGNTVGGTATGAGNVISANSGDGVFITGSGVSGNVVEGNYIGTDKNGTNPLNNGIGVVINAGAASNTIGGTVSAALNVISGNTSYGVEITGSGTNNNVVAGNYIGTAANGTNTLSNGSDGVFLTAGASGNTVGGSVSGALNVISANGGDGVDITASGNAVEGNYIGTDKSGTAGLGNTIDGVYINGGANNTIGGTATAARNVISSNSGGGVFITGSGATGNVLLGNYIGTDKNGTANLGNSADGVSITSSNNTIGGSTAGAGNVISANAVEGVYITGGSGNVLQGNYIGTNKSGTASLPNGNGLYIYGSANNTIGGSTAGARNIISGNGNDGVFIQDNAPNSATGNVLQGNYIGVAANGTSNVANAGIGLYINTSNTTVGGTTTGAGNVIAFNGSDNVLVDTGTANAIRGNSIHDSGNLGIELINNANNNQVAPAVTSAITDGSLIYLTGTITATKNTTYALDFFASPSLDGLGNAEGQQYLGSALVTTDSSGKASFTETYLASVPKNYIISATATDPNGNTSAFSTTNATVGNPANQFVVTNNSDSGAGSLRAAITSANGATGLSFIDFNISGSGAQTINLASALPTISNSVVLDGASQPGFSGTPLIVLNGSGAGNANGLTITSGKSFVEDLAIDNFSGDGIDLQTGGGNVLTGNYIGVASDGKTVAANGNGVFIESGSSNNTVGGLTTADRNVISANGNGVYISGSGASGNVLQGNYIGTDATGTQVLGNSGGGVYISSSASNTVGGTFSGAGNVISNNLYGVEIGGSGASGNVLQGNYIGTNTTGTANLGNSYGVVIYGGANNNAIGGTTAGAGNVIAYSTNDGVNVNASTGNAIHQNSIHDNGFGGVSGLGIDLVVGGNNSQAAPTLSSATTTGAKITIAGTLTAGDSTKYTIEFFANPTLDKMNNAEGQQYIGSVTVTTNASGTASFSQTFTVAVPVGYVVSATATDPTGNTSEFATGEPVTS